MRVPAGQKRHSVYLKNQRLRAFQNWEAIWTYKFLKLISVPKILIQNKLLQDILMYRTVLWTLRERERVGRFGRMALKHVKYHVWNELPVQVWCRILDAWGWCTGMTQRDGVGKEEGGGFRMGNTCIPVADSFWYLAKLIQLCTV